MNTPIRTIIARAHIVDSPAENVSLRLRAMGLDQIEPAKGAKNESTIAAWPLEPRAMIDLYNSNPWLAAIGNVLGDAISGAAWDLVPDSASSDANEEARARQWLSRSNVGQDGVTPLNLAGLLKVCVMHLDSVGNVFLEAVRNKLGSEIMQLNVLLPQFLRYESIKIKNQPTLSLYQMDTFWGEYRFGEFGTRKNTTDAREFLHQRLPNLYSSFYGLPAWLASRDSIAVDNAHRAYLKSFFGNHSAPRWMIQITEDPSWQAQGNVAPSADDAETVYTAIINYLNANRGAMGGRNLVLLLPGGIRVDATPLDQKIDDPTFGAATKSARDEIMAVRHVSLINLGVPEGGYRATAEAQGENFRCEVLEPFSAPIIAMINQVLLAPAPHGLGIAGWKLKLEFTRVAEYLQRIEAVVKAVGVPVLTQNEGRDVLDFKKFSNPTANDLHVPINMIPTSTDDSESFLPTSV